MLIKSRKQQRIEQKYKKMKKWRLIVRNLPFMVDSTVLKESFVKYGEIFSAVVPKKKNNENAGFGFVQFERFPDAVKALKAMNTKKIKNRVVVLDWAVPKDAFISAQMDGKDGVASTKSGKGTNEAKEPDIPPGTSDSDKQPGDEHKDAASESSSDHKEDDDDDEDEDSEVEKDHDEEAAQKEMPPKRAGPSRDVTEGRTVFIRNLSYDTEEDTLKTILETYGPVKYALVCRYRDTEHSKGSGFAQFLKKEAVDDCLKAAEGESGIVVDGRRLNISIAIGRTEAKKLDEEKHEKTPKDLRNWNLLKAAVIIPGTPEARGMSDRDAALRSRIDRVNQKRMQNNNYLFVSPNRLCVHNLPKKWDDRDLRGACLVALKDLPGAKITESRVMKDLRNVNAAGLPKSTGFGFVTINDTDHAMAVLKYLNNNPDVFGYDDRRPIVEFSIENKKALNARKLREDKSKQNFAAASSKNAVGTNGSKTGGSGSDTKRQRNWNKKQPAVSSQKIASEDAIAEASPNHSGKMSKLKGSANMKPTGFRSDRNEEAGKSSTHVAWQRKKGKINDAKYSGNSFNETGVRRNMKQVTKPRFSKKGRSAASTEIPLSNTQKRKMTSKFDRIAAQQLGKKICPQSINTD